MRWRRRWPLAERCAQWCRRTDSITAWSPVRTLSCLLGGAVRPSGSGLRAGVATRCRPGRGTRASRRVLGRSIRRIRHPTEVPAGLQGTGLRHGATGCHSQCCRLAIPRHPGPSLNCGTLDAHVMRLCKPALGPRPVPAGNVRRGVDDGDRRCVPLSVVAESALAAPSGQGLAPATNSVRRSSPAPEGTGKR
jgi:hypothetical protein